jgi:uncharacterized protein YqgV (UPF0045/DUF77 family)
MSSIVDRFKNAYSKLAGNVSSNLSNLYSGAQQLKTGAQDVFKAGGAIDYLANQNNQTQNTQPIQPTVSNNVTQVSSLPVTSPLNPGYVKPMLPTDTTKSPVVQPNISDIQTQAASIQSQIENIQKELDASKTTDNTTPADTTGVSKWDKLMGKFDETQNAILTSQQNLTNQTNAIYDKWGLTPENFNQLKDLSVQIGDVNKQIAALDTREAQALEQVDNTPGQDLAFMSGEKARISRAYAIQRSGLAAKASAMASTASALQGNWDTATKMAQNYVDSATMEQQQTVSDLKWGIENYSSIIQAMSVEEQSQLKAQVDYETTILKQQQDDHWKQMNYDLNVYKAQQGIDTNTPLNQLRELQIQQLTQTTPGQLVNAATGQPVKLTESQITDFQRYDQYINDLIPLATTLLDPNSPEKVGTGGVAGTYMKTVQNLPLVQRTLSDNQNKLLQVIATMNNQLIYMLSGKQINEQEYKRLKAQLPDVTLTNKQNMIRMNEFNKIMQQARDKKMSLMGLKETGTSTQSGGNDNDPLGIR